MMTYSDLTLPIIINWEWIKGHQDNYDNSQLLTTLSQDNVITNNISKAFCSHSTQQPLSVTNSKTKARQDARNKLKWDPNTSSSISLNHWFSPHQLVCNEINTSLSFYQPPLPHRQTRNWSCALWHQTKAIVPPKPWWMSFRQGNWDSQSYPLL